MRVSSHVRTRPVCEHGGVTTPEHDFLGWAPDSAPQPVWDAPAEWTQSSPPAPSELPRAAPSPDRDVSVPTRPVRTPSPQQPRTPARYPASAPAPPPPVPAPGNQPAPSRSTSALNRTLARATLASVVLAGFMIFRVIGSGGFRNGLLALVLSIIAIAMVVATVLRARNVP